MEGGIMTQWGDMLHVRIQRDESQHQGVDPAFQCGHCRKAITLLGCTFTANTWGEGNGADIPGALVCPLCGKDAASAFVQYVMKMPGQPRLGVNFASEEDAEGEEH